MSKDLYPKANEIFEAATREGEFQNFSKKIGLDNWIIFELDLFERAHQKRLIETWQVFQTGQQFTQILRGQPQFGGLKSEAFHNVGFELWQMYESTPRSYEEFAQRTREVLQEFSRLSEYRNTLQSYPDDYEIERELKKPRSQTRWFVRRSLDWILMYIPGFSREAIRRITQDETRKDRKTRNEERLERQREAIAEEPILKHAHQVDVEILLASFPTRALEEIRNFSRKEEKDGAPLGSARVNSDGPQDDGGNRVPINSDPKFTPHDIEESPPTPPIKEEPEPVQGGSAAMMANSISAELASEPTSNQGFQLMIQRVSRVCQSCGADIISEATFCYKCGSNVSMLQQSVHMAQPGVAATHEQTQIAQEAKPMFARAAQMFGLHPIVAFATFAIDIMLFGEEAASLMVGWVIAIPVALVLGVGIVFCQRYMYRDEWGAAIGKAIIVALLVAIPTAIPTVLLVPSAALGVVKAVRRNKR